MAPPPNSAVTQFLSQVRSNKGGPCTHTCLNGGRYDIPDIDINTFHDLLYESVFEQGHSISLTEMPREIQTIKVDLDERYPLDESDRKHQQIIPGFVKLYQDAVKQFLSPSEEQLRCYVFERNEPYKKNGNSQDGIHLMFPHIVCHVDIQHLIRLWFIQRCDSVLSVLNLKNSYEDAIDESIVEKNAWIMYGCSKPDRSPYLLTHIYNSDCEEIDEYHTNRELISIFSIHRKPEEAIDINPDKAEILAEFRENKGNKGKKITVAQGNANRKNQTLNDIKRYKRTNAGGGNGSKNIEELTKLVNLLSVSRADNYYNWMEVGWCLHNIGDDLLHLWIEFSTKSAKFQDGICEREWYQMRYDNLELGSLHRWARLDNPEGYAELIRETISGHIMRSVSLTTFDIAKVIYEMYKYNYVCVSVKDKLWYEFRNHRWYISDCAVGLRKKLSNDVMNEYLKLIGHFNQSAIGEPDDAKDPYLSKSKSLTDVTYKLRDYTFKEKLIGECTSMFHDDTFLKKLDSNTHLIGFENGVYDLRTHEFRDGRPEDCISLTTGNDFVEFDDDDIVISEIHEFMAQLFVNNELREYMYLLMSSFLLGMNPHERFYIFTGSGANGKSKIMELLRLALGEYATEISTSIFTQKKPGLGQATPEVAQCKGRRLVAMQELEENEKFNIAILKSWTGNDILTGRELYRPPVSFMPQFKLVLCCNHMPKVPADDDASWRRIRVIEFMSRFVEEPNPKDPYQFQKDPYLVDKLKTWKEGFMWIIINKYRIFEKLPANFQEPKCVLAATLEYKQQCDLYKDFMDEYIEQTEDGCLKLRETYKQFKEWYKASADSGKAPCEKDFKSAMQKRLGKYISIGPKAGWKGYSLKNIDTGLGSMLGDESSFTDMTSEVTV